MCAACPLGGVYRVHFSSIFFFHCSTEQSQKIFLLIFQSFAAFWKLGDLKVALGGGGCVKNA
jgi:hypothetical protein